MPVSICSARNTINSAVLSIDCIEKANSVRTSQRQSHRTLPSHRLFFCAPWQRIERRPLTTRSFYGLHMHVESLRRLVEIPKQGRTEPTLLAGLGPAVPRATA